MNKGKQFSTQELYEKIWRDEPDGSRELVWVYVSYLRQKLAAIAADLRIEGERDGSFRLLDHAGDSTQA